LLACSRWLRKIPGSNSGRVKPNIIKLIFAASSPSRQHYVVQAKTGWLGIRIICLNGATCLPTDCCFSELALNKNPNGHIDLVQSKHHHHLIKCNLFLPWYGWIIAHLALSNNHSLSLTEITSHTTWIKQICFNTFII
jgi:hypothetical protein